MYESLYIMKTLRESLEAACDYPNVDSHFKFSAKNIYISKWPVVLTISHAIEVYEIFVFFA